MLVYPSGIDLSSTTRERGTRGRRLGTDWQVLLVLAHMRCGHTYAQLAAGFGVGLATVYRYISEAVEVLAALAPDLTMAVWATARKACVILDGTRCRSTGSPSTAPSTRANTRSTE